METNEERKARLFGGINSDLLAQFKKYHIDNPKVYELFAKYAWKMKDSGRPYYSHWAIINRIRWDHDIKTTEADFKIKNDYIALFARLLIYHQPEFDGFFRLKRMKG